MVWVASSGISGEVGFEVCDVRMNESCFGVGNWWNGPGMLMDSAGRV